MKTDKPIIRFEDVYKSFNGEAVLKGLNLSIQPGCTTVIIGPSGCGKSVLLKHMVGLLKPDRGRVFFHNHDISQMPERRLVSIRRRMGFLFQGSALFDSMTVEQNICFPMSESGMGTKTQWLQRCNYVLSLMGLEGLQQRYPEELSGGQKKRVALARAIVLDPEVIFYDEPTTGLDPIRADLINELIVRLHKNLSSTAVVVTHDMTSAKKIGQRILMLHDGKFIADTTPEEIDAVQDETFVRFVQGRASQEELDKLETGKFLHSDAYNE